jgi:hypothetical protein
MTIFRTLTAWQHVVKANGANTKLVTRTKSENYYQAIRDGHIIGFFNDSTVPAGKSSGEFDVRVFDAASSPRMVHDARYLVVIDTMWSDTARKRSDAWFAINPDNHSGKRLYKITNSVFPSVWVTNACPQRTTHATRHGVACPKWLRANLTMLSPRERSLPLLVCGVVARAAYEACGYTHDGPVVFMMHPAARTWSKKSLAAITRRIATLSR